MNARAIVAGSLLLAVSPPAFAQGIERYSLSSNGTQGDDSSWNGSTTPDGRYAIVDSFATNLVAGDGNAEWDVFVCDRFTGAMERVSVDSAGVEGNLESVGGSISDDGRFVAFASWASNLVSGDGNGTIDVFVRDRAAGTTVRVSVDSAGAEANGASLGERISADGRYVAFRSDASNLSPSDTNGFTDVFVRDLVLGTTELVSVGTGGTVGNAPSWLECMSPDGRYIVFTTGSSNLVAGDTNGVYDVFMRDRQAGTTERVSLDSSGAEANDHSWYADATPDGRFIAFQSDATNLVAGDTNGWTDIFVRDRANGTTDLVSVRSNGTQGNFASWYPELSDDGSKVVFTSLATNLVGGDRNVCRDAFLHDRTTGVTRRLSVNAAGKEFDRDTQSVTISPDGTIFTLGSDATNAVPGDTNGAADALLIGPELRLSASPVAPPAGATLSLDTWTGLANGPALIVVTDVNGAPTFVPAVLGTFDAAGRWAYSTVVPNGLTGNVVTVETFGIAPDGKVAATNAIALAFQ